ncbi:MAG: hypothetical protein M0P95_17800 [Sulfuritalea sp.]|jgi:hypothetical protein|nr:hypothetical protein [Sulfuritalea sp.]
MAQDPLDPIPEDQSLSALGDPPAPATDANAEKLKQYGLFGADESLTERYRRLQAGEPASTDFTERVRQDGVTRAGVVLGSDQPVEQKVQQLRAIRHDIDNPSKAAIESAARNSLIAADQNPQLDFLLTDPAQIVVDSNSNVQSALQKLAEFKGITLKPNINRPFIMPLLSYFAQVPALVLPGHKTADLPQIRLPGQEGNPGDIFIEDAGPARVGQQLFTDLAFPIVRQQQVANAMRAGLGEGTILDNVAPQELADRWAEAVKTTAGPEGEAIVDRTLQYLSDNRDAWLGGDYRVAEAADQVFHNLGAADLFTKHQTAFAILDIVSSALPFVGPAVRGVAGLVHTAGSAAETAGKTASGTAKMTAAANAEGGEAALKAAGTTPGTVAQTHAMPTLSELEAAEVARTASVQSALDASNAAGKPLLAAEEQLTMLQRTSAESATKVGEAKAGVASVEKEIATAETGAAKAAETVAKAADDVVLAKAAGIESVKAATQSATAAVAEAKTAAQAAKAELKAAKAIKTGSPSVIKAGVIKAEAAVAEAEGRVAATVEAKATTTAAARAGATQATEAAQAAQVAARAAHKSSQEALVAAKAKLPAAVRIQKAAETVHSSREAAVAVHAKTLIPLRAAHDAASNAFYQAKRTAKADAANAALQKQSLVAVNNRAMPAGTPTGTPSPAAAAQPAPHINRTVINATGNSVIAIGRSDGLGYATKAEAEAAGRLVLDVGSESGSLRIVQNDTGKWFVLMDAKSFDSLAGLDLQQQLKGGHARNLINSLISKALVYKSQAVDSLFDAFRRFGLADAALKKIAEPLQKVHGEQMLKLQRAFNAGEGTVWWDDLTLAAQFGLKPETIVAYRAVQKASDITYMLKNSAMYSQRSAEGYSQALVGGRSVAAKPMQVAPSVAQVLDARTGAPVSVNSIKGRGQYIRFAEVQRIGSNSYHYGFVREGDDLLHALDPVQIHYTPGRIGRAATTRYVIRVEQMGSTDGGTAVRESQEAVAFAQSARSAARWIADQRTINPGTVYRVHLGREIDTVDNLDAGSFGLRRAENKLIDVDGADRAHNVLKSVEDTLRAGAESLSWRHWQDEMITRFNATFEQHNIRWETLAKGPTSTETGYMEAYKAATVVARTIMRQSGFGVDTVRNGWHAITDAIGQSVYGVADYLPRSTAKDILLNFGDNFTGVAVNYTSAAKTAAFLNYIVGNLGGVLTQTANWIIYTGMKGGKLYALGPSQRDMGFLVMARYNLDAAKKLAAATGLPKAEADNILDLYNKSGISWEVGAHVYATGGLYDAARVTAGRSLPVRVLDHGVNAVKAVTFDAPVKADLVNALLFSRNRFKEIHGRLPTTAADRTEVFGTMREAAFGMNTADSVAGATGLLSTPLQFMSHIIKYSGAVAEALTGNVGRWGRGERLNMLLLNPALFTGAAGVGAAGIIDWAKANGITLSPEWSYRMREGLQSFMLDKIFQLISGDEDPVRLAYSEKFAATNSLGPTIAGISQLLQGNIPDLRPEMFGAVGSLYDVVDKTIKFSGLLSGQTSLPAVEQVKITALRALEANPAASGIMNALWAENSGYWLDSSGSKVAAAHNNELIARVFGIRSTAVVDVRRILQSSYGPYAAQPEQEGQELVSKRGDEGKALWNDVFGPLMKHYLDGKLSLEEFYNLYGDQVITVKGLTPSYLVPQLFDEVRRAAESDLGPSLYEDMANRMLQNLDRGTIPLTVDRRDYFKHLPDFPGKDKVEAEFNRRLEFVQETE